MLHGGELESAGDDAPIFDVGCAGRVIGFQETDDGRFLITLKGVCRYRIEQQLALVDGYRRVRPDFAPYMADLHADAWPRPEIFRWIEVTGGVDPSEMYRTFNCGIGMTLCVPASSADSAVTRLTSLGEQASIIGEVTVSQSKRPEIAIR